mmetsp:Transcript_14119/g.33742  ORF Transcript_14119/g.33742 Transcript_14119/m.33742 type:complete len:301 (-) Transcript_14119:926-1828(-)
MPTGFTSAIESPKRRGNLQSMRLVKLRRLEKDIIQETNKIGGDVREREHFSLSSFGVTVHQRVRTAQFKGMSQVFVLEPRNDALHRRLRSALTNQCALFLSNLALRFSIDKIKHPQLSLVWHSSSEALAEQMGGLILHSRGGTGGDFFAPPIPLPTSVARIDRQVGLQIGTSVRLEYSSLVLLVGHGVDGAVANDASSYKLAGPQDHTVRQEQLDHGLLEIGRLLGIDQIRPGWTVLAQEQILGRGQEGPPFGPTTPEQRRVVVGRPLLLFFGGLQSGIDAQYAQPSGKTIQGIIAQISW